MFFSLRAAIVCFNFSLSSAFGGIVVDLAIAATVVFMFFFALLNPLLFPMVKAHATLFDGEKYPKQYGAKKK
jgi:hypothetical protein